MKWKRSERLVDMTRHLLEHPHMIITLSFFSEKYGSAKSSISEDLSILKETFETMGYGTVTTLPGASGGVFYRPKVTAEEGEKLFNDLMTKLSESDRLLPGGYLYVTDLISNPKLVDQIGKVFASIFAESSIDAVMTIATKGIPIAQSIARHLDVPIVIVRRDSKVTEGSTVSINYVSGSTKRIQTMTLSKRSMKTGQRILLTDDFMKAGGTLVGMKNLLAEFECELAGIAVLLEAENDDKLLKDEYVSLVKLTDVDEIQHTITLERGNFKIPKEELQ